MFCCTGRFKKVDEELDTLKSHLIYLKQELDDLHSRQLETNRKVKRIIDTFTLKEYVLYKTRLLTLKQTKDLVNQLYIIMEVPEIYKLKDITKDLKEKLSGGKVGDPSLVDKIKLSEKITRIEEFENILDKLRPHGIKYDVEYDTIKSTWCKSHGKDHTEFLNTIIKALKTLQL
jgi:hypothetical protein